MIKANFVLEFRDEYGRLDCRIEGSRLYSDIQHAKRYMPIYLHRHYIKHHESAFDGIECTRMLISTEDQVLYHFYV